MRLLSVPGPLPLSDPGRIVNLALPSEIQEVVGILSYCFVSMCVVKQTNERSRQAEKQIGGAGGEPWNEYGRDGEIETAACFKNTWVRSLFQRLVKYSPAATMG